MICVLPIVAIAGYTVNLVGETMVLNSEFFKQVFVLQHRLYFLYYNTVNIVDTVTQAILLAL